MKIIHLLNWKLESIEKELENMLLGRLLIRIGRTLHLL